MHLKDIIQIMMIERDRTSLKGKENILARLSVVKTRNVNATKRIVLGEHNENIPSRSAFGKLSFQSFGKKNGHNKNCLKNLRDDPSGLTHIDQWTNEISRILTGSSMVSDNACETVQRKSEKYCEYVHVNDHRKRFPQLQYSDASKNVLYNYTEHKKQLKKCPIDASKIKVLERKNKKSKNLQKIEEQSRTKNSKITPLRCVDPIAQILNHSENNYHEEHISRHQNRDFENSSVKTDSKPNEKFYEMSIASLPVFTQKLENTVEEARLTSIKKPVAFYPSKSNGNTDEIELDFSFII